MRLRESKAGGRPGERILVGAWFYDGWSSTTPEWPAECEDKTQRWPLVTGATPREIDFLFTTGPSEVSGFVDRGVPFSMPRPAAGNLKIHRLVHGRHLYTTDPGERDRWIAEGATYDGALGEVFPKERPGTARLFRAVYNGGVHELTVDERRAWHLSGHDRATLGSWLQGHVYADARTGEVPVHCQVRSLAGHDQPRIPLLGNAPLSDDQRVMDRYIAWAGEFGIDFFAFEWFWQPRAGCPNRLRKGKALENAFMESALDHDVRFTVGWFTTKTDDQYPYTEADVAEVFAYIVDHYTGHPRYLRIGNRPVVCFTPTRLITLFGHGEAGLRRLMRDADRRAMDRGFDGIYWVAIGGSMPGRDFGDLGFDGFTRFTLHNDLPGFDAGTPQGSRSLATEPPSMRFEDYVEAYTRMWPLHTRRLARRSPGTRFIPVVGTGSDMTPVSWKKYRCLVTTHITPDLFARELRQVRAFVESDRGALPMVLINAWNEWLAGGVIEPTTRWGTAFLEQVKTVFDR
jgi:hypothetical protein